MGGAERNEKKRRQEAAAARLHAAGIQVPAKDTSKRLPLIVAGVLTVALAVGLTIFFTRGSGAEPVVPTYSATVSGTVITAGNGPVAIYVYSDYLCPACERFEERYGDEITTALNNGQITVRYHGIAILDDATNPPGYSTRAANAAICAVPAGIFPTYHATLFAEQPAEGSPGLTDDQLIALGVGAQGDFAGCVRAAATSEAIAAASATAAATPGLAPAGRFGTPTVATDGVKIDIGDESWLQDAIARR